MHLTNNFLTERDTEAENPKASTDRDTETEKPKADKGAAKEPEDLKSAANKPKAFIFCSAVVFVSFVARRSFCLIN